MNKRKTEEIFDSDIKEFGSYKYTDIKNYSSKIANQNISKAIEKFYDFKNKIVLDVGCGDGTYSFEIIENGAKKVIGIDISSKAIEIAQKKKKENGIKQIFFHKQNIYNFNFNFKFDIILLRGVLHHTKNPREVIDIVVDHGKSVLLIEPNGYNPILKILEKFSKYHIEHKEKSFFFKTIKKWLRDSGAKVIKSEYINLVPFFCPKFLAIILTKITPLIIMIPFLKQISFGQIIILCKK